MSNENTPYRSTCEVCELREKQSKEIYPYTENQLECLACKSRSVGFYPICTGGDRRFNIDKGKWFFGYRNQITFSCELPKNSTNHFHLRCSYCRFRWMMKTALSVEKKESQKDV